jgi:hypothetical protein
MDQELMDALDEIRRQLVEINRRLDAIDERAGYQQRADRESAEIQEQYGIPTRGGE